MSLLILGSMLSALGHGLYCCAIWGRVTSARLPYRFIRWFEKLCVAVVLLYPAWLAYEIALHALGAQTQSSIFEQTPLGGFLTMYRWATMAIALTAIPLRLWQRTHGRAVEHVTASRVLDLAAELNQPLFGTGRARLWGRIPGNQVLELELNEKQLFLPRLASSLDGLAVAHLSDLHFTGRIARAYFERAAEELTAMRADLIVVTGDILDRAACRDWFAAVFKRLSAPLGVYGILGNHDRKFGNLEEVRQQLEDCGVTMLSGRWTEITVHGERVLLAGNELPWMPAADLRHCANADEHGLRLLLAHSPDQLAWARERTFDVVVAGHTHGGQVQFPVLGAVMAPSRFGTRYASGTFYEGATVMHVTRGLSALHCLRIRCRPEITRLVLRRGPAPRRTRS